MTIIYRGEHPHRIESVWGNERYHRCRTNAGHVYRIENMTGMRLPKPGDTVGPEAVTNALYVFEHQSDKRRMAKPIAPAHIAAIWKDGRVTNKGGLPLWSGKGPVPAIGATVTCNDKAGTQVTVTGYTVEEGWLMVTGFRTAEPAKVGNLAGTEIRWPKVEPVKTGPIDFNTATMADVIKRSMVCHPSMLVEAMMGCVSLHARYSRETSDRMAAQSAYKMADACRHALVCIERDDADALLSNFSAKIQTFEQACRLQLVPHGTRAIIATREDGSV